MTALERMNIPSSVKCIGQYAFYKCERLASVNFADSSEISKIQYYAFCECSSLTRVVLPKDIDRNDAFGPNTEVVVPRSVPKILTKQYLE